MHIHYDCGSTLYILYYVLKDICISFYRRRLVSSQISCTQNHISLDAWDICTAVACVIEWYYHGNRLSGAFSVVYHFLCRMDKWRLGNNTKRTRREVLKYHKSVTKILTAPFKFRLEVWRSKEHRKLWQNATVQTYKGLKLPLKGWSYVASRRHCIFSWIILQSAKLKQQSPYERFL